MSAFHTAQFYELLGNRSGRLEREGNFLLKALASAPCRQVADLACGPGIHAKFLADHGADVVATDLSPEMVSHAREKRPHPHITYETGDMREPKGGPYGLIICLGNSLSLLQHTEDLRLFFFNAANALASGGLLITQTLNYETDAMKRPRIRTEQESLENGDLVAVKRFLPRENETLLSITYYAATTEAFIDTTETVHLHHWSKEALVDAATAAQLQIEDVYGGFDASPIHASASDNVLLAQRP
jgi:2-polyprenyl-3-methyl-5-hydroxy-6-metoxy-1,4-benzoquinol methylase